MFEGEIMDSRDLFLKIYVKNKIKKCMFCF